MATEGKRTIEVEEELFDEVCDILHGGLSCLDLEVGVSKRQSWKVQEFAELRHSEASEALVSFLKRLDKAGRLG